MQAETAADVRDHIADFLDSAVEGKGGSPDGAVVDIVVASGGKRYLVSIQEWPSQDKPLN